MFRQMTNSPTRAKLQRLHDVLGEKAADLKKSGSGFNPANFTNETIGDDGGFSYTQKAQITRDEQVVREALDLVGVVYDDLIRLDGPSPYKAALEANPQVAADIQKAENPVLAALKVAQDFAPVADFVAKYGDTPEAIKAAMQAELGNNAQSKPENQPEEATKEKVATMPFSKSHASAAVSGKKSKAQEIQTLRDIFTS